MGLRITVVAGAAGMLAIPAVATGQVGGVPDVGDVVPQVSPPPVSVPELPRVQAPEPLPAVEPPAASKTPPPSDAGGPAAPASPTPTPTAGSPAAAGSPASSGGRAPSPSAKSSQVGPGGPGSKGSTVLLGSSGGAAAEDSASGGGGGAKADASDEPAAASLPVSADTGTGGSPFLPFTGGDVVTLLWLAALALGAGLALRTAAERRVLRRGA